MSTPPTTVEIFHDYHGERLPTESVQAAIGYIATIAGAMEIVGDTRRIKIVPDAETDFINIDAVRWPRLDADVNLVLTARPILSGAAEIDPLLRPLAAQASPMLGAAIATRKLALIDIAKAKAVKSVATHEVGHLYRLKESGLTKSASSTHCILDACVMHETVEQTISEVRVPQIGFRALREKVGLKKPEFAKQHDDNFHTFCTECAYQLGKVAFFRAQKRSGRSIPDTWI